jgi:hypothetical protein
MTISFDFSSDKVIQTKSSEVNLENSDDNITDYCGSGDEEIPNWESLSDDNEREIEYFDCFKCKKRTEFDDDCYLIEDDENTGELVSALCGSCKEDNLKCITCDRDLDCDDNYRDEVKLLLYQFGKIENCISCLVTTNKFTLKPNVEDLEIGKDKDENLDLKSKYEDLSEKHRILQNIYQSKEEQCSVLISQNESIILDRDKYKNKLKNIHKLLKENDILYEDEFLQFLENYKNNNLSQNINKIDKINPLNSNNLKYLEEKVYNINIKNKINEFKLDIIDFRKDFISYKISKKNLKKKRHNLLNEFNTLKSDIKNMKIFKVDFDVLCKEYEDALKIEKEEQIKKLYEKLKENKISQNIKNDENNIIKIINKLENQKVEKLYFLADLGKEFKQNNIRNESEFLEQIKDNNDIYYIYDLKSKNKISRFINMCNKLYLLKDKINLGNILKNNVLTQIRDISVENFEYLLSLFN